MKKTLFLYLDILGFSELVKEEGRIPCLFEIIDTARIHNDSNFKVIVFSDTLIAYNKYCDLEAKSKEIELMYLIEFAQDIFLKLIGKDIFFRAVITEGEFVYKQLKNIESYYGQALVDTYNAEKMLSGTGLFLNRELTEYNKIFRYKKFSKDFDFIFLTDFCSKLTPWLNRNVDGGNVKPDFKEFPLSKEYMELHQDLTISLYPELIHFKNVYYYMNNHENPKIREKYLTTWNMYEQAYPSLIRSLLDYNLSPEGIAEIDWSEAQKRYEQKTIIK